jgi:hypothetical protein
VSAPGALPQSRPQSRPQSARKAPAKLFLFFKVLFHSILIFARKAPAKLLRRLVDLFILLCGRLTGAPFWAALC